MIIEPELFECYHCNELSLRMVTYSHSIFHPEVYTTDGANAQHTNRDFVSWCGYCEKFVVSARLKHARDITPEEKKYNFDGNEAKKFDGFEDLRKKYMTGSKKYQEEWHLLSKKYSNEKEKHKWFTSMHFPDQINLALQAPELSSEADILYKLRILFWREINYSYNEYGNYEEETEIIFPQLLKEWEGKTDERYLFKAELLRNTKRFDESRNLLMSPEDQYIPILRKLRKWARVIRVMNILKLPQTVEIRI